MKIDLADLFNGSEDKINIDYCPDLSKISVDSLNGCVKAVGCIYSKADVVYLKLSISYTLKGVCDRCAEDTVKDFNIEVDRIIVENLQNESDDDGYIVVKNRELDIDELINEEIVLSLPVKFLCSDNCKGLCSKCGTNLNVKKCDCKKETDPRMSALLQLLEDD